MTHSSCISHPAYNQRLQIYLWQVFACDGDVYAAALLSHIEALHNQKYGVEEHHQQINDLAELHHKPLVLDEDILIPVKLSTLRRSLFNLVAEKKISDLLDLLAAKSFISIHSNPDPEKILDRAKYIKFYPEVCNAWIRANYDNNGLLINLSCGQLIDSAKRQSRFSQKAESIMPKGRIDSAEKENRHSQQAESEMLGPVILHNDIQVVDFSDNAKTQSRLCQQAESARPIDQSISRSNTINPNQRARGDFSQHVPNSVMAVEQETCQAPPQMIIDALVLYGFAEKKLAYPDVMPEIIRLQLAGATQSMFMEAYEISNRVTNGRGFGFKYLVKAVECLLTKTQKLIRRHVNNSKKIQEKPTVKCKEVVYEHDLTNAQSWAGDLL